MVKNVLLKAVRSVGCLYAFLYVLTPETYADFASVPALNYPEFASCVDYPPAPPHLVAKAFVLVDFINGQIIAQKGERIVRPIASITKLMTALITLEALARGEFSLEKRYKVLRDAVATLPHDASRVGFVTGDAPTGLELLKGLLIRSGNDAALVIALHVGGTVSDFVAQMNARALELGLVHTAFADPTGLSPDNKSTALEISRLALHILNYKNFDILSITRNPSMIWKGISYRGTNFRLLVHESGIVDGLKTGYIEEAQFNLAATAIKDKRRLVAVVLGVEGAAKRNREVLQLLNYGFGSFSLVSLRYKTSLRVWGGKIDMLSARAHDKIYAVPASWVSGLRSFHILNSDLWAPVQKEVLVGSAQYEYKSEGNSCPIARLGLMSTEVVEPKFIQFFDKVRYFFYKRKQERAKHD